MPVFVSRDLTYPESDGQPMGENTRQVEWIFKIFQGLQRVLANAEALVAADLFWYPVEDHPEIVTAPDVLVALGRPQGHRGSYLQWREANQPPQVVFEVLSPSNRPQEMLKKLNFYQTYGVEEYYLLDPETQELWGWKRLNGMLMEIPKMDGWVSPLLKIRFRKMDEEWQILSPENRLFLDYREVNAELESTELLREELSSESRRAEDERLRADEERRRADEAAERAEAATEEIRRLREQLKVLGHDPEM